MRSGLRLQLLVLLGALMILAFGPLFFATRAYTRLGFERARYEAVLGLAHSIARHVVEVRPRLGEERLLALLSAQAEGGAVQALFVYDPRGQLVARAGEPELMDALGPLGAGERGPWTRRLRRGRDEFLAVFVPSQHGGVAVLGRLDDGAAAAAPLTALMGLYMVVIGLLVLAVAYFALTHWIVRPILALESAAERVARGGRRLEPLGSGPAELVGLSRSLSTMTQTLLHEEDSLRRKIEEVEAATRLLEAAQASLVHSERLATVGRLSAGLAHEIGNPIQALVGFVDLLLEGGSSESEQRDFLERMRREIARIHRVLGDLLAYARAPRRGAGDAPGSVAEAVDDVLGLLRPQKDLAEVRLEAQVSPGLPRVPLSQEELTQALLNLVMNAVDACERRGRIDIVAERGESGGVRLLVRDDGPGVAPSIRETLFEPFVSTKEVGRGTGLGLSVTRGLVESAQGTIFLEPTHAPGACFVIWLPEANSSSSVTA